MITLRLWTVTRKCMLKNLCISFIIAAMIFPLIIEAQIELDPASTVQIASGKMGFQLPLVYIRGTDKQDYPITLDYSAGVQYYQESSPIGLGFSCLEAFIVRSPIYVPDDNFGGTDNYNVKIPSELTCDETAWQAFWRWFGYICTSGLSALLPNDYTVPLPKTGGGTHTPTYDFENNNGAGFFRGGINDLPDMYYISTPFISGKMVWCGDREDTDGHFTFIHTSGSAKKNAQTVKVDYNLYDPDNPGTVPVGGSFIITLNNGTRLFFEKSDAMATAVKTEIKINNEGVDCESDGWRYLKEATPVKWWLTKVLYPTYGGGGDPENSNSKGWVVLKYTVNDNLSIYRQPSKENMNTARNCDAKTEFYTGKYGPAFQGVRLCNLAQVVTPNESAELVYLKDGGGVPVYRQDVSWFATGTTTRYANVCPILKSIRVKNKSGACRTSIEFNSDYFLRPNTAGSLAPEGRSLSLLSFQIGNGSSAVMAPVTFSYNNDYNKDASEYVNTNIRGIVTYRANRDLWGYYYYNVNYDWHASGVGVNNDAQAWSLEKITLPNKMSIKWNYEESRYDSANGARAFENERTCVLTPVHPGDEKFGGGIRVASMEIENGVDDKKNIVRYFYVENSVSDIIDKLNGNSEIVLKSSGNATCEPFPALTLGDGTCNDEIRPNKSRGGLYTEAGIIYGKVAILDGKLETSGIKLNEYYTSAMLPNEGDYGEIDNSWKRGNLLKSSSYNSDKQLVSQTKTSYEFIEQKKGNLPRSRDAFEFLHPSKDDMTYGWAKLVTMEDMSYGVTSSTRYKFASDLNSDSKDNADDTATFRLNNYSLRRPLYMGNTNYSYSGGDCIFACIQNAGESDKPDMLVGIGCKLWGQSYSYVGLSLLKDPNFDLNDNAAWIDQSVLWFSDDLYEAVTGMGFCNLSSPSVTDIVPAAVNYTPGPGGTTIISRLKYCLFKNIRCTISQINGDRTDVYQFKDAVNVQLAYTITTQPIAGCGGALNLVGGADKNDLVFVMHWAENATEGKWKLVVAANVDYATGKPPSQADEYCSDVITYGKPLAQSNVCITDANIPEYAKNFTLSAKLIDADGVGGVNDLVVTGLEKKIPESSGIKVPYRVLFKNIVIDGGKVKCDAPQDAAAAHFNVKYFESSWKVPSLTFFSSIYPTNNVNEPVYVVADLNINDSIRVIKDGVIVHGDYDGQPNQVWDTNSDGKKRITVPIPAYWKYAGMGQPIVSDNKHMLTQPCQNIIYEKEKDDNTVNLQADQARSSNVILWNTPLSNGVWLSCSTFVWEAPMDINGASTLPLSDFPFSDPASRELKWKFKSGTTGVNAYCSPREEIAPNANNANAVYTSTVYGTDGNLPVGSISNAQFQECGVFTGDYWDGQDAGYWDYDDGWERGIEKGANPTGVELVGGLNAHFGQKCIHVIRDYAACRNSRVYPGKAYRMSAWVKVTDGTIEMATDFRYANSGNENDWPARFTTKDDSKGEISATPISKEECNGFWKLMSIDIPASVTAKLENDKVWYARAWVGKDRTLPSFEAYVDDIRFGPANSLTNTIYYDDKWQQAIMTVDANDLPGQKIEFDDFGRPVRWSKIDRYEPSTPILLIQKRYFVMRDGIIINNPKKNDKYFAGKVLPIKWLNDRGRIVDIYIASDGNKGAGATWGTSINRITPVTGSTAEYSYNYPIPPAIAEGLNYAIKIQDANDSKIFCISGVFSIMRNAVISPNSSSQWIVGNTYQIEWVLEGASTVDIYYDQGGTPSATPILSNYTVSTENAFCNWTLPFNLDYDPAARIRIIGRDALANPLPAIMSEAFTINKKSSFIRKIFYQFFNW